MMDADIALPKQTMLSRGLWRVFLQLPLWRHPLSVKIRRSPFFHGILVGLSLPPLTAWFFFIPLIWGMYHLLRRLESIPQAHWKTACRSGFLFAAGYHLTTLYWVSLALHVDIAQFWPVFLPALLGLPLGLSLFFMIAIGALVTLTPPGSRRLFFPFAWIASELAQAHLFTGFPWNPVGLAYANTLCGIQITHLIGIHGLSFLCLIALSCMPPRFSDLFVTKGFTPPVKQVLLQTLVALSLFILPFIWGGIHLYTHPTVFNPHVRVALIQPNTRQTIKYDPLYSTQIFQTLKTLMIRAQTQISAMDARQPATASQPATLFVWPESATVYDLINNADARTFATNTLAPHEYLMTGLVHRRQTKAQPNKQEATPAQPHHDSLHNSLGIFNHQGDVLHLYDKTHLVPFGEYIPLRRRLPFDIEKVTHGAVDFTPGKSLRTLKMSEINPKLPNIAPLVCYEVIFSGDVIDPQNRPDLFVNVTNDGWYLNSSGPYQHLAHSRLRAIEEGIPLVRVASTGISAVFDALGREVKDITTQQNYIPYGISGIHITALPKPQPPLGISRMVLFGILMFLYALYLCIIIGWRRNPLKKQ